MATVGDDLASAQAQVQEFLPNPNAFALKRKGEAVSVEFQRFSKSVRGHEEESEAAGFAR